MQVVYEIVQDDIPIDLPLFTDLERARFELNKLIQAAHQEANNLYHDAFVMPGTEHGQYPHVTDAHFIMACQGQLEYVMYGLWRREINTATLGDSHS